MVNLTTIPYVTASQMIEVDRLMVDVYGIQLIQMMENAGRHLAALARDRFLDGDPNNKQVVILAGSGGNGGGALTSARNLHNWGARVEVCLTRPGRELTGEVSQQAMILQALGIELHTVNDLENDLAADLIIDGIIGYNLQGPPRGSASELICWANNLAKPILSLDVPSGLDPSSGRIHSPAIRAKATMTLVLPKTGLESPPDEIVGELYLADIGVPPGLYQQPSLGLLVGQILTLIR